MGGVVSEVGDIGQGIISGVDQGLTQLDDAIPQEAKIAAAIYAASQGIPVGAEGAALSGANAAVAADSAYLASSALTPSQLAAAAASSVEASQLAGLAGSSTTPSVLQQLSQIPTSLPSATTSTVPTGTVANAGLPNAIPSAVTNGANMTAQQVNEIVNKDQAASTGLLGTLGNLSTAQQLGLGAAALGATGALGGSTPTSSTATTSIDPDIKAAFLRNLGEARETAAGLGTRQFAPYAEYNLGMVQQYMNPYENQVVQNTLADIERARQGQISAEGARATAAGAFGGTRQAVTRSLVDEAALRNAGPIVDVTPKQIEEEPDEDEDDGIGEALAPLVAVGAVGFVEGVQHHTPPLFGIAKYLAVSFARYSARAFCASASVRPAASISVE